MHLLITGITSFRNRGVEALVTTTIAQLRPRLPGIEFLVLDRMPEYDAACLVAPDVRFKLDETVRPLYASRARRALLQLSDHVEALGREYQSTLRDVQRAVAVVASGGDVFGSEYGHQSLLSHLAPLKVAQKARVPVFLHAQSVGPFKNDADTQAFSAVARDVAHITVRERMSYNYLTRELGLPAERVTLTADPAFLLARTEAPWREYFGFKPGRPVIALSTSQAICNWMGSSYATHFRVWCDLIAWLRQSLDAGLILIPHVQELSTRNDDRILATELVRHFRFDPNIQLAGGDYTAADFKGIISQCDLVVAERMHAAIAGLSSGVPTVVVGYSVKGEGILTDLLGSDLVKDAVLLPLPEFLEVGRAQARVNQAWQQRGPIAARLREQLPAVRERSALSFDILARHLQAGKSSAPEGALS